MPQIENQKGVRRDRRQIDWRKAIFAFMSILIILSWILALIAK